MAQAGVRGGVGAGRRLGLFYLLGRGGGRCRRRALLLRLLLRRWRVLLLRGHHGRRDRGRGKLRRVKAQNPGQGLVEAPEIRVVHKGRLLLLLLGQGLLLLPRGAAGPAVVGQGHAQEPARPSRRHQAAATHHVARHVPRTVQGVQAFVPGQALLELPVLVLQGLHLQLQRFHLVPLALARQGGRLAVADHAQLLLGQGHGRGHVLGVLLPVAHHPARHGTGAATRRTVRIQTVVAAAAAAALAPQERRLAAAALKLAETDPPPFGRLAGRRTPAGTVVGRSPAAAPAAAAPARALAFVARARPRTQRRRGLRGRGRGRRRGRAFPLLAGDQAALGWCSVEQLCGVVLFPFLAHFLLDGHQGGSPLGASAGCGHAYGRRLRRSCGVLLLLLLLLWWWWWCGVTRILYRMTVRGAEAGRLRHATFPGGKRGPRDLAF